MIIDNECVPSRCGSRGFCKAARWMTGDTADSLPITLVIGAVFFFFGQHYFTVNFSHENQKALELRTEDAKDCDEWVAAIAHARYASATPRSRRETGPHPGQTQTPGGEDMEREHMEGT